MWMWLLQLGQHRGLKMVEPQDRRSQGPCTVECHACLGLPASGLLLHEGDKYFYFVSITASLDFIPCNFSVPCSKLCNWTHIAMTPFMWKKKRRNLYMCTRWTILTLAQKPQGNLLQHWRHIIILHNKPRGGAASGLANSVAGLHHQGLRDFPSFSFAIFWLDPVIIARWWLQFQATRSYISITRREGTPFLLQLFFCLFVCLFFISFSKAKKLFSRALQPTFPHISLVIAGL